MAELETNFIESSSKGVMFMINAAIIAANAACTVAAQVATHAALQANRRLREWEEEDEKRRKEKKSMEEKKNV